MIRALSATAGGPLTSPRRVALTITPGRRLLLLSALIGQLGIAHAQAPAPSGPPTFKFARDPKRVLGVYSARQNQAAYQLFEAAFTAALRQGTHDVDYYAEYLDYGRVPTTDAYLRAFRDLMR